MADDDVQDAPKGKSKLLIIIIAVVVLLAAGGGAAFFFMGEATMSKLKRQLKRRLSLLLCLYPMSILLSHLYSMCRVINVTVWCR